MPPESIIFTPWTLGKNLILPNRIVRSAIWEGMSNSDGTPGYDCINFIAEAAQGQVGLVIAGFTYISPGYKSMPRQNGIYIDAQVGPFARVSDAVHQLKGKVALQIGHGGGMTKSAWLKGPKAVAPSSLPYPLSKELPGALTKNAIADILDDFASAAARAKAAGFDAVQIHGAHGYLISQFLSPLYNKREDEYGGSWENRTRFCRQAYQAVRAGAGPSFPVMIKLQSEDSVEGGFTVAEAVSLARDLDGLGIDAIEVSGGSPAALPQGLGAMRRVEGPGDEGYFFKNALAVKAAVSCPVISVGGWRSKAKIENALSQLDAVSLARPLICQPDLLLHWRNSAAKAQCVSCNACLAKAMRHGVSCAKTDA